MGKPVPECPIMLHDDRLEKASVLYEVRLRNPDIFSKLLTLFFDVIDFLVPYFINLIIVWKLSVCVKHYAII